MSSKAKGKQSRIPIREPAATPPSIDEPGQDREKRRESAPPRPGRGPDRR